MQKTALLALGRDRPGIVAGLTQALYDTRCNIEDTSMTILEDYFAMLFIVTLPEPEVLASLKTRLTTVAKTYDLQWMTSPIDTHQETLATSGTPWMITVTGADQTGIMFHVTQYLAASGINIRHLSSRRAHRESGETLFLMALEVDVPAELSQEKLTQDLQALASEQALDIAADVMDVYTL